MEHSNPKILSPLWVTGQNSLTLSGKLRSVKSSDNMPKDTVDIVLEELRILQKGFGEFANNTNNRLANVENDIADLAHHIEAIPALQKLVERHDHILLEQADKKEEKKNFLMPIAQSLLSAIAGAGFFYLIARVSVSFRF